MDLRKALANVRENGLGPALRTKALKASFGFFQRLGVHVLPVHYYSPVPDTRELRATQDAWFRPSPMRGVELDVEGQLERLEDLGRHAAHLADLPDFETMQRAGLGPGYGEVEAHVLTAMILEHRPARVIEVGCGVSSLYTLDALDHNGHGALHCIEPYPGPALRAMQRERLQLQTARVQDVPVSLFESLEPNDILFIDSSHVSKLASDVDYLFLEVLPALARGVLIHVHDISLPWPCPDDVEGWIYGRQMFWNENALMHAFLCFNSAFRVLLSLSCLHHEHPKALARSIAAYDPNRHDPTSLWLRKTE